jgi:hypothetical protein
VMSEALSPYPHPLILLHNNNQQTGHKQDIKCGISQYP